MHIYLYLSASFLLSCINYCPQTLLFRRAGCITSPARERKVWRTMHGFGVLWRNLPRANGVQDDNMSHDQPQNVLSQPYDCVLNDRRVVLWLNILAYRSLNTATAMTRYTSLHQKRKRSFSLKFFGSSVKEAATLGRKYWGRPYHASILATLTSVPVRAQPHSKPVLQPFAL